MLIPNPMTKLWKNGPIKSYQKSLFCQFLKITFLWIWNQLKIQFFGFPCLQLLIQFFCWVRQLPDTAHLFFPYKLLIYLVFCLCTPLHKLFLFCSRNLCPSVPFFPMSSIYFKLFAFFFCNFSSSFSVGLENLFLQHPSFIPHTTYQFSIYLVFLLNFFFLSTTTFFFTCHQLV